MSSSQRLREHESGRVTQKYNAMMDKVRPCLRQAGVVDLNHYVTRKALDGLFHMVGQEEQKIRTNPVAQTTDLLKKVFGSNPKYCKNLVTNHRR